MNYARLDERPNGLVLTASLDKMLFEERNRTYGAYQMRMSDTRRLMISTYFTAAIVLIITLILFFRFTQPGGGPQESSYLPPVIDEIPVMEMPIAEAPETPEDKPATPTSPDDPAPLPQEPLPTQAVLIPEPSPVADDTSTVIAQAAIVNPGATNSPGGGTVPIGPEGPGGTGISPVNTGPITLDETNPDYWTAKQPQVLNLDKIKASIVYPRELKEIGYDGDVVLKILVDETGKYHSHKVMKSSHKLFLSEVESKVKNLVFTPGNQGGKDVRVWVTLPFKFRLSR